MKYISPLLLVFIFSSCTQKIVPQKNTIETYSEDISYLIPQYPVESDVSNDDDVKEKQPSKNIRIVDDNDDVEKMFSNLVEENKSFNNGIGYRIQIFSGNSKSDFESAKGFILRNYPELEIYESYSHPTYKIKTGDFIHLQDAIRYNLDLKNRFITTRILNEKINLNKALNIK